MINIVVEGRSDEEMAAAVVRAAGGEPGKRIVKGGAVALDRDLPKYIRAAAFQPWVVFRDSDGTCPVELRRRLVRECSTWPPTFRLRIAHPMAEAWLLADSRSIADFFSVRLADVPANPGELDHPKRALVRMCEQSRSAAVRADMVAKADRPGPLYVRRLNEFAAVAWNVDRASGASPSLRRAIASIRTLL